MHFNPWMTLLVGSLLASGCSSDDDHTNTPNSSKPNSNVPDSGSPDSETPDSGMPDSGAPDSDTPDSGVQCQLEATAASTAPSIAGKYADDWGIVHEITADTWTMDTSVFHLSLVDNTQLFAIAQNDCANPCYGGVCFGGKWSRFDWTYDADNALRYCQTAYAAESREQALQTPAADAQDLDAGCSGFAWSKLTSTP